MTNQPEKIAVHIKYGELEKTFSAPLEEAWLLLNKIFNEFLPSFEIVKKLQLNVDLQKLAKDCKGVIAFSEEGANLLVSKSKVTDNETLLLWLLGSYLGHKLGILETEAISKEELRLKLGKSSKITSTRLGELVKNDLITKTSEEEFRITTLGIVQMQKEMLPKIQTKTNA